MKRLAQETNTICIATIHQPNWEIYSFFDRLTLLAGGRMMYNGPASMSRHSFFSAILTIRLEDIDRYLTEIGYPTPQFHNPADQAVAIVNTEFYNETDQGAHLDEIVARWAELENKYNPSRDELCSHSFDSTFPSTHSVFSLIDKTFVLTQRNFFNYARNLLAFGIRSKSYLSISCSRD